MIFSANNFFIEAPNYPRTKTLHLLFIHPTRCITIDSKSMSIDVLKPFNLKNLLYYWVLEVRTKKFRENKKSEKIRN